MNSIDDVNRSSLAPSSLQPADFVQFLEGMKGLLEELGEEISKSKNFLAAPLFSGALLAANHQVNILGDIEKMRLEMENFLQQGKGEGRQGFRELSKVHEVLLRLKSSPLPEGSAKQSSPEAGSSKKKAQETLFPLRGESKPAQSENSLNSPASGKQASETLASRPSWRFSAAQMAFDAKVLDKTPAADLWQKVKPLLDHLIVVVETQENMSKPSQKLVELVRSLVSSHASFEKLDISPLFKGPAIGKKLESSQVSYGEKTPSSSLPKSFPPVSETSFKAPASPFLKAPSPIESLPLSSQNPQKSEIPAKSIPPTPTSAPFTPEKKIEKRKTSTKKKLKRFWSRKDQEEEDKNPS